MKQKRYTTEEIVYGLKQAEAGEKIVEICRKMGVSDEDWPYGVNPFIEFSIYANNIWLF